MAARDELTADWGTRRIPFRVVRDSRNTLLITVAPDGMVCAHAPNKASNEEVIARVARRGGWISRQLERFNQWKPRTPERQYVSGETHLFLGKQYRLVVCLGPHPDVVLNGDRIILQTREEANFLRRRALLQHWYKLQAHKHFPPRLDTLWPRFSALGINKPRLMIRLMMRRWGSFTPAGNLVLNSELAQASPHLIDYVLTHEIAHGVHPNHGPEWQLLMTNFMPDWRDRKAELERQLL